VTSPLVGWYAHHLGAGHVNRAMTVSERMQVPVVILSSAPRPTEWPAAQWISLPSDVADGGRDHAAGGTLHWAPLQHQGYRDRMARISAWVNQFGPTCLVSDVSVEVLLLGRLLGVPTVGVVMAGDRSDTPHQTGYDAASRLVASWPRSAEPVLGWRSRWDPKTTWVGAMSRFDGRAAESPPGAQRVAVLWGRGSARPEADLVAARAATPDWRWTVIDSSDSDEVWRGLQAADVVVTHGGQNALAEIASARRPAVVVPQERPHDEQRHLTAVLDAPVSVPPRWPAADDWPELLGRTAALDPRGWARWSDGKAAARFAAVVDGVARMRAA
jgi:hypothetical protein